MEPITEVVTPDGTFRTGCIAPSSAAVFAHIPVLADTVPILSVDKAKEYIDKKNYNSQDIFKGWIRNQGGRGSCNGYAGAKALQRARMIRRQKFAELSGEGLYAQINGGQDQGSMLYDAMAKIMATGVPTTASVPYEEYRFDRIKPAAWEEAKRFKGEELYAIKSEPELVTAHCLGFMVVVAVHAGSNWTRLTDTDMVPRSPGAGNHAVGVDDIRYSLQRSQFEYCHFGSWGESVHNQGYAWLSWNNHLATTVGYHGFYAIRSTIDDPQDQFPVVS